MPLATLHLISISPKTTTARFLDLLQTSPLPSPLVIARVIRWIIRPEHLSVPQLLDIPWDLLLILPGRVPALHESLRTSVAHSYSLTAGIPSSLTSDFASTNRRLLSAGAGEIPALTGSLDGSPSLAASAQRLELSREVLEWSGEMPCPGPVSMLNLLAFQPGDGARESYRRYGEGFARGPGRARGGVAKLVGKVVVDGGDGSGAGGGDGDDGGWEEFALAHYPSARHFADMAAGADYQDINQRWRLPSLRDTCILCTSEVDPEVVEWRKGGGEGGKARL